MKDDYLWSRSGEPDPDIARLEALLEPLRHRPMALDLSRTPVGRVSTTPMDRRGALALAAGLVIFVAAGIWLAWIGPEPGARVSAWRIASSTRLGPSPDSERLPGTLAFSPTSGSRPTRLRPCDWRRATRHRRHPARVTPSRHSDAARRLPARPRERCAPRPHLGLARAVRGRNLLRGRPGPRLRVYARS